MYKIYYKVRSPKRDGSGVVYVMMRCANGEEITRTTKVAVVKKDFNMEKGKVSTKDILHREKNEAIGLVVLDLEDAAREVTYKGHELTKARIEEQLPLVAPKRSVTKQIEWEWQLNLGEIPNPDTLDDNIARLETEIASMNERLNWLRSHKGMGVKKDLFTDRIDEFVRTAKSMKKETTKGSYTYLRNTIKRYNPNLELQDVSLSVVTGLQIYLATTPTKDGTKRRNSSILGHLVRFQAVYEYFADDLGLPTAFFKKFEKVEKLANENVVYLTKDELDDFATVPLKAELQNRVREQFLLFCETGLRQVDGCFRRSAVFEVKDRKGRKYKELRVNQEKVKRLVSIPLSKRAEEILERNNYEFAPIPNNHFNQAIRQIAQKVPSLQYDFTVTNFNGSDAIPDTRLKCEFITGKVGRKTFVNNCFERSVSETTVAAWLGHKNTLMVQKHYKHRGDVAMAEAHKIFK